MRVCVFVVLLALVAAACSRRVLVAMRVDEAALEAELLRVSDPTQ